MQPSCRFPPCQGAVLKIIGRPSIDFPNTAMGVRLNDQLPLIGSLMLPKTGVGRAIRQARYHLKWALRQSVTLDLRSR